MKWFGQSWGAPICESADHIATPVGQSCMGCETPFSIIANGLVLPNEDGEHVVFYHVPCLLHELGIDRPSRG
jgi:hypothetical protein